MDADVIDLLIERNAPVIPTMSVYDRMRRNVDNIGDDLARLAGWIWDAKVPRLRAAVQAGVRIGVGTDSCSFFPADDIATELSLLVQATELTPEQVLTTATRVNAEILRISDQTGTLEVGKSSDMIVVDGNPFENIEEMRRVYRVIAHRVLRESS
jgi:imidazolonepropionase-like amidohydrolase